MQLPRKIVVLFALSVCIGVKGSIEEEEHGVIYANRCEACKILANELEERLKETGRSHDVIEVGYVAIFSSFHSLSTLLKLNVLRSIWIIPNEI